MLHLVPRWAKSWLPLHLFLAYVFILSGLIVNTAMLITSLLVWPFNRRLYRVINYYLAYSLWAQFTYWAQWWSGIDVVLYMAPEARRLVGKEHCLVLLNHKYDIDWLMGWILTERFAFLGGSKVFVKHSLRWVPIIGWAWYFTETIFLRRQWDRDRVTILRDLSQITDYPPGYNVNILLFAEGTRFTEDKLLASNAVAEEKGIPTMKHTLLPRTRGFVQAMVGLRGQVDAVYDCTVAFPESRWQGGAMANGESAEPAQPSMLNVLNGVPFTAHYHCRRIPVSDIPEDEKDCADWLYKMYKDKDDEFEEYLQTGRFPGEGFSEPIRMVDAVVWTGWALLLSPPLGALLYRLFLCGTMTTFIAMAVGTLVVSYGVRAMIGVTETERGSSYGRQYKHTS